MRIFQRFGLIFTQDYILVCDFFHSFPLFFAIGLRLGGFGLILFYFANANRFIYF